MPGIIDDPGSLAGKVNSPKPDLGPDAKNLISLIIFNNESDKVFKEFEKLINGSWEANDSNLFGEGL